QPTGLETRFEYSSRGDVRARRSSNVPGAPCTGTTGTLLDEVWSLTDITGGMTHVKSRNPDTTANSEQLIDRDWAWRSETVTQLHVLGADNESSSMELYYDNLGQLESFIDARGTATFFAYDAVGRLTDSWHN